MSAADLPVPRVSTDYDRSTAPAESSVAVDIEAEPSFRAGATLYVGSGGDLVVQLMRDADGTKRIFKNVGDGSFLPIRVKRVWPAADGTTAGDIIALL